MELIESHAEEWAIDPRKIAVVGFSAGGHLTACVASVAKHKPAACIPVYPAIVSSLAKMCDPTLPAADELVTPQTAPCFVVA